jgi:hypothetical protein
MIVRLTGNVSIDGVKATLETPVTLDSYIETGINSKMVLDNGIIIGSLKKGKVKDFRKNVVPVGTVLVRMWKSFTNTRWRCNLCL